MTKQRTGRREFLVRTGIGVAAAGGLLESTGRAAPSNHNEKASRIASNSYAVRHLFKRRPRTASTGMSAEQRARREAFDRTIEELKRKYGEITLLDFPQFTRDTYSGVRKMDVWSSLFGDVNDDSQFAKRESRGRTFLEFDPSRPASKRWLDRLADNVANTGVAVKHISNNAPRNIADMDEQARREGIRVARLWLDAAAQIGATSMRVNTGGPRVRPQAQIDGGYPRDREIVPYMRNAIESFKAMADHGEKVGVKVTIENHWGLAADPMNIRIIINEVGSPYCEASPDFCNWEHEYMLYHGLEALVPMATSMIHAKRWTRYPDVDIPRCVEVLNKGGYKGDISLEYEAEGDPVEGTHKLMADVVGHLA